MQPPQPLHAAPWFWKAVLLLLAAVRVSGAEIPQPAVDATALRGKVLCGYQGWFRCPGDAANMGWVHWSRDGKKITPETLSFEMWPDLREFTPGERFAVPGFTYPDGKPAELFSSDNARTVLRHFEWMRDHGIDGVWLQHFAVDLPGGPAEKRYTSRMRTLDHVRSACQQTGRVWALTYDLSGLSPERIYDTVSKDWLKMIAGGITNGPRYLHQDGKPVVEVFGFYHGDKPNSLSIETANQLIDFFEGTGAYLVGGGEWYWRRNPDADWQKVLSRLNAWKPWNIGNVSKDKEGVVHAATGYWADDKKECEKRGQLWLPVVYPGFSWDNLQRKPAGTTIIPRRKGSFLWEQFHALSKLGADSVMVAMFDEVDEGTAIFKVMDQPPAEGQFVGLEGMPSDWYLRLVGEATRRLREKRDIPLEVPNSP
jgi:hypothetical protein